VSALDEGIPKAARIALFTIDGEGYTLFVRQGCIEHLGQDRGGPLVRCENRVAIHPRKIYGKSYCCESTQGLVS